MASSSGAPKVCFNSTCNQALEVPRRGWLCRTGDFADLCDRCGSAFDDGKFCDTYHLNASGWRSCESCGKQIHCGCIVSFHMFILLDAGGIECLKCAKTEYILTPNPTWPSASHFLHERINDVSDKSRRSIAGSGPVPWRQAPTLFNGYKGQPEVQVPSCSLGQSGRIGLSEKFVNRCRVNQQETTGDKALAFGTQYDGPHNLFKDVSHQSFFHTNTVPLSSSPSTFVPHGQKAETGNAFGIHVKRSCTPPSVVKQCSNNNNGSGPSLKKQTHNTTARGETHASHHLPPRYWPQCTDQELQHLYTGSNSKITPLFEKVLSASDTGKIGRLVLPKKCAEAYLPSISEPEGFPLVIQDWKGKDWLLQYRFWPNNNSRMYVLEGVTPYIQSMQLQAGDTVTFGRLEPEGKLVMGFRKVSNAYPSDKGNEIINTRIPGHEADKISISANKRKKGGVMCSNSKNLKHKEEETSQLSVTLEQVQGLLRPPLTNAHTIALIDGVEFEAFQDAPIIGIANAFTTDDVGSFCSTEIKPSPEHQEHTLPVINHENSDSLADLAVHDRHLCHKPSCTCNVCLSLNRRTPPPMMHYDPTHPKLEVGNRDQNPTRSMYADIICYSQMETSNCNHIAGPARSSENELSRDNVSDSTFKGHNIDLNMQPEREEESYLVSDSMGIMSLVQESTQRYMKQQKLSINGITDGDHKNHDL